MNFALADPIKLKDEKQYTKLETKLQANADFDRILDGAKWIAKMLLVSVYNSNEKLSDIEASRFYRRLEKDLNRRVNKFVYEVEHGNKEYIEQLEHDDEIVRRKWHLEG